MTEYQITMKQMQILRFFYFNDDFENVWRYAVFFFSAAMRNKIFYHTQQGLKRKISRLLFKLFLKKFFTLSRYSPVTYTILLLLQFLMKPLPYLFVAICKIFFSKLSGIFSPSDSTLACVSYSLELYNYRNSSKCLKILAIIIFCWAKI